MTNALTGVAISGYDPVAYFTEGAAQMGDSAFAYEWEDAVWYFTSAANRDVFIADPDVYAPLFGGHCATSIARGYLSDGNPNIYRIIGNRLVLFHSIGNRAAFSLSPAQLLSDGLANWSALPDHQSQGQARH